MFKETGARSMTLYELLGKMQPKNTTDVMAFSEFWNAMEKGDLAPCWLCLRLLRQRP